MEDVTAADVTAISTPLDNVPLYTVPIDEDPITLLKSSQAVSSSSLFSFGTPEMQISGHAYIRHRTINTNMSNIQGTEEGVGTITGYKDLLKLPT